MRFRTVYGNANLPNIQRSCPQMFQVSISHSFCNSEFLNSITLCLPPNYLWCLIRFPAVLSSKGTRNVNLLGCSVGTCCPSLSSLSMCSSVVFPALSSPRKTSLPDFLYSPVTKNNLLNQFYQWEYYLSSIVQQEPTSRTYKIQTFRVTAMASFSTAKHKLLSDPVWSANQQDQDTFLHVCPTDFCWHSCDSQ